MKLFKNSGKALSWPDRLDKYTRYLQSITGWFKADTIAQVTYTSSRSVHFEVLLEPRELPYTLLLSTYHEHKEAMFLLTAFYEGKQGDLKIVPAPRPPRIAKGEPY